MRLILAAVLSVLPFMALAAGSDSPTPPKPTATTTECEGAQVYDTKTETCIDAVDSRLDDATRYQAARELAYAGRLDDASAVLDAMRDQQASDVLTYRGFIARKSGQIEQGFAYYQAALDVDPGNLLARSYMGQGYVTIGDLSLAQAQLDQIRARGGAESWAETSLARAIADGVTYSY